MRWCQGWCI